MAGGVFGRASRVSTRDRNDLADTLLLVGSQFPSHAVNHGRYGKGCRLVSRMIRGVARSITGTFCNRHSLEEPPFRHVEAVLAGFFDDLHLGYGILSVDAADEFLQSACRRKVEFQVVSMSALYFLVPSGMSGSD